MNQEDLKKVMSDALEIQESKTHSENNSKHLNEIMAEKASLRHEDILKEQLSNQPFGSQININNPELIKALGQIDSIIKLQNQIDEISLRLAKVEAKQNS